MSLPILLFLFAFPGIIGTGLHMRLVKRPAEKGGKLFLFAAYCFALFWISLLVKYMQGWGDTDILSAFGTVVNLFKYGTVEIVVAVLIPLAISLLYPLYQKYWLEPQAAKGGK